MHCGHLVTLVPNETWLTNVYNQHERITKGFVQLGHNVEAIIGSAYPGFGFSGRNSAGLLLVNFGF